MNGWWSYVANFLFLFITNTQFCLYCSTEVGVQTYKVDLTEEAQFHGGVIVTDFVDEEVGELMCNGIAIILPCVDVRDIPSLKARIIAPGKIEIQLVEVGHSFIGDADSWLGVVNQYKKTFKAAKLRKTLGALVTAIKRKEGFTTKKIILDLGDEIELSNEYFSEGLAEGDLQMLPFPYEYTHKVQSKATGKKTKFTHKEVMCVWRAFIVGTDTPLSESQKNPVGNDSMDLLCSMMDGAQMF